MIVLKIDSLKIYHGHVHSTYHGSKEVTSTIMSVEAAIMAHDEIMGHDELTNDDCEYELSSNEEASVVELVLSA